MEIYGCRLTKGMDLQIEIERIVKEQKIEAGVILSSVGCVLKSRFRVADGVTIKEIDENLELLSLNGTLSLNGNHLHITCSNQDGICYGGHLMEGNIINTTCELVIGILKTYKFNREFDAKTGYDELIIK